MNPEKSLTGPFDIARHENDNHVALAQTSDEFLQASKMQDVGAVLYEGYDTTALESYLNSGGMDKIKQATIHHTVIKAGEPNQLLQERLDPVAFDTITELANLFCETKNHKEISFKMGVFSNTIMHDHLADQMILPYEDAGAEWPKGQAPILVPFMIKANFPHKSPDSAEDRNRTICIFSAKAPGFNL